MYPQGFAAGSSPGSLANLTGEWSTHYVSYWLKYSKPYSNQVVGTKQWYPYNATADYFVLFNSASQIQIDVQAPVAQGGSYNLGPNISNPTITLGVWHQFELYFRRSSTSSTADGIIRWWIDGVLCATYTNVTWPNTTFDQARFEPVWGGITGTVAFDSYWWVDHIHLSQP